jgi:tetratricopeptide (TPR) repeat protein
MKKFKLFLRKVIIALSILIVMIFISLPTDSINIDNSIFLVKLSENIFELLKHIIGEIFGFLALGGLFVYFFKGELIEVIKKGMESLAKIFSDNLSASRQDVSEAAHAHLLPILNSLNSYLRSGIYIREEAPPPNNIINKLAEIHQQIKNGNFTLAEKSLLTLKSLNPNNLTILNEIHSFYSGSLCQKTILDSKQKLLNVLKSSEEYFDKEPSFYKLLGFAYIESRDVLPTEVAKISSLEALQKGKLLDKDNPRWDISIGFYHYIFDNIDDALRSTEHALLLAQQHRELGDDERIACIELAKNNIAFYLACKKERIDIAMEYALSAYNHFSQKTNEEIAMVNDTLGFVRLQFSNSIKEVDTAIELLGKALKLDPSQDSYANRLQLAYQKRKTL